MIDFADLLLACVDCGALRHRDVPRCFCRSTALPPVLAITENLATSAGDHSGQVPAVSMLDTFREAA